MPNTFFLSAPAKGNNPLFCASDITLALEKLHAEVHAEDGSVVSTCSVRGGQNPNVIPEICHMEGTVRYLDASRGAAIEQRIREVIERLSEARDIVADLDYRVPYSLPTINSEEACRKASALVRHHLGPNMWHELEAPSMGAEDFAYYLDGREGAMLRLGVGVDSPGLHNPAYNFNDEALANGIFILCALALSHA